MEDAKFDKLMQRAGTVPRVRAKHLIQLIQEAKAEARNAAGEGGGDR